MEATEYVRTLRSSIRRIYPIDRVKLAIRFHQWLSQTGHVVQNREARLALASEILGVEVGTFKDEPERKGLSDEDAFVLNLLTRIEDKKMIAELVERYEKIIEERRQEKAENKRIQKGEQMRLLQ